MSIYTIYDYVSSVTADYTAATLSVDPQDVMLIGGEKNVAINPGLGVSEERIILSSTSRLQVKLQWSYSNETDHSTLFDWYHDPAKACGIAKSFYWTPPAQYLAASHDLTVRFDFRWESFLQNYKKYGVASLILAILGKKPA